MSPLADPSVPVCARIALAVLMLAFLLALLAALAGLAMGTHHPARTLVEVGVSALVVAIGAVWDRRRSNSRRPR